MRVLYILVITHLFQKQISCATNHFTFTLDGKIKSESAHESNKNSSTESREDFDLSLTKHYCKEEEYLHKFINNENKSHMLWVTWNRTRAGERALLPNICSVENGLPLHRRCRPFGKTSQWEKYDKYKVLIDCRISMFCKPEPFEHFNVLENGNLEKHRNTWKQATIGEHSGLQDLCLQPIGLHLTRKCFYDIKEHRAIWASVDHFEEGKCFRNIRKTAISSQLNALHESVNTAGFLSLSTETKRQTAANLFSLLQNSVKKLLPADIQLTSSILKIILTDCRDVEVSEYALKIAHSIMSTELLVLRISAETNATNSLLETFENYLDGLSEKFVSKRFCNMPPLQTFATVAADLPVTTANDTSVKVLNLAHIGVYAHITRNISVFFVNPSCTFISGIAIYDSYQLQKHMTQQQQTQQHIRYDSINNLYFRFVYMNESVTDLLHETYLELASFIPTNLWNALQINYDKSFVETTAVVFKIYAHDGLFVEQKLLRTRKPFSKIVSISLPGIKDGLPGPLPFILRHTSAVKKPKASAQTGCGYWNYSTWVSSGVHTKSQQYFSSSDLILCSTNHLTQFSYLIGGSFRQNDLSDEILVTADHQEALDIISLIGCSLSLLGLIGIWVTALLFKSWRSQASNKVLLNLCVAVTVQMVLFLFINTDDVSQSLIEHHNYTKCVLLGAFLQYSILVLFTWMLIVAILQFQRYVTVIGINRPKHYITKSAAVAWGVPLIPTLLVALLDSKSYIPTTYQLATDTGICYPSGTALHLGVTLPVALIVVVNFTIFLYVFYSISRTLSLSMQRHEKRMVIKQIRLSILLFFLLGISWIFGIFAFMKAGIVFSYLFCLTATLQGFVLFIYFVILDENARTSWQKLVCANRFKKARTKTATELQSMTTGTTSLTPDSASAREH